MAQSCLRARALHCTSTRHQRRLTVAVRAESGKSVNVTFKIQRHVDYGQSLMLVGGYPELGSWDAKGAVTLTWNEGDNWTSSPLALPIGAAVEYKYIIKRKEGLDWCPGQNKSVSLPTAAAVEVTDKWEPHPSSVAVTTPLSVAAEAVPAAAAVAVDEARAAAITAAAAAASLLPEAPVVPPAPVAAYGTPAAQASDTNGAPIISSVSSSPAPSAAVVTVDNVVVEEAMDGVFDAASQPPPAAAPAPPSATHEVPPPGSVANNIVQGLPRGAVSVGAGGTGGATSGLSADPGITAYEEADKMEVVEVGAAGSTMTAVAAAPTTKKTRSMDSMTVSELKSELKRRGLSSFGSRRELITRLQNSGGL